MENVCQPPQNKNRLHKHPDDRLENMPQLEVLYYGDIASPVGAYICSSSSVSSALPFAVKSTLRSPAHKTCETTKKYAINLVLTEEDLLPNIESIDGRFGDVLLVTSASTRINMLGQVMFTI